MANEAQPSVQLSLATFRKGSYITIEGKRDNDFFFIIKQGQVVITKETDLVEGESGQVLNPGDFFGVVAAMSGHPRDETARALSDVALIAVKRDQFGVLIQKNTPIAMKIIRSFSQKLRHHDHQITKLTLKEDSIEDTESVFGIGDYYFNQNSYKLAMYAYVRYLQINPNGINVANAKDRLKTIGEIDNTIGQPVANFNIQKPDGEFIFCEHEPGNECYIIQGGNVKITKILNEREVLLAVLKPGDIFGEMAILDNKPRSASAIAYGGATLLAVNKANFETMVASKPQLATKLIQLLSERIWTTYRQLANILIKEPVGRLYDILLTELEKNHIPIQKRQAYTFNFGAQELIQMGGLPAFEGKEALRELLKSNNFTVMDEKIVANDMEQIQKQTEYYRKMTVLEQKREKAKSSR